MTAHAKYSPSKMQRTIACPGSVALESRIEDRRSSYADEGTVAHALGAECLEKGVNAAEVIGASADVDKDGSVMWYGGAPGEPVGKFQIDDEFAAYVQVYVDSVRRRAMGGHLFVEQRVEFSKAIGVKDQFGTSDAIIVKGNRLTVMDLKFGMGVKVYAKRTIPNPQLPRELITVPDEQLMTYAVAVLETFDAVIDAESITEIELVICQPRLDHEDDHVFSIEDLRAHASKMRNAVLEAVVAQKALDSDGTMPMHFLNAGDKQCKFCKAFGRCPAPAAKVAEEVGYEIAMMQSEEKLLIAGEPVLPSPQLIGARYGVLPFIESWCKALRAEAERMVFSGVPVVGPDGEFMKIVEGKKGNRVWKDAKTAEGVLAGMVPHDKLYKPREIVTPAKIEPFFGGKKKTPDPRWADVQALYHQKPGSPSVALGSDPRPAWSGEMSDCEFEDMTAEDL